MNFLTEKKAQEKLKAYMQAETAGRNSEAAKLEKELNDAGWFITSGPDGMTVKKKGKETDLPEVDDFLIPKDSTVQPYLAPEPTGNRKLWIALGITAGVIGLTVLVIYLIKRKQHA